MSNDLRERIKSLAFMVMLIAMMVLGWAFVVAPPMKPAPMPPQFAK